MSDNTTTTFEYILSPDDFARVYCGEMTSYIVPMNDRGVKVGDKLALTRDNVQIIATVTAVKRYRDYVELPNERYGFNIGTYNPYFYDNESAAATGGVLLASFRTEGKRKLGNVFTDLYFANAFPKGENVHEIYLVRRDKGIFSSVGYGDEIVFRDCFSDATRRGIVNRPTVRLSSNEQLLGLLECGIPTLPARPVIENGCFTESDYTAGVYLIRLELVE